MNSEEADNRIQAMISFIRNDAEEKQNQIIEKAKQKMQKEKNKVYNYKREQLIEEYRKREENDQMTKRLEKSRKINMTRLEV